MKRIFDKNTILSDVMDFDIIKVPTHLTDNRLFHLNYLKFKYYNWIDKSYSIGEGCPDVYFNNIYNKAKMLNIIKNDSQYFPLYLDKFKIKKIFIYC